MKTSTVKKILEIDLSIQIALVVLSIMILSFTARAEWAFVLFYFGLGAFQLISFFLHFKRRRENKKLIRTYQRLLLFVLIFTVVSFTSLLMPYFQGGFFMLFLVVMLFIGIIMALIYINLTTKDISKLKRKILWNEKEL
jgi:predicted membrane channel-forming protein YqfA (hemolysin III family)